jgi:hypothetical protein
LNIQSFRGAKQITKHLLYSPPLELSSPKAPRKCTSSARQRVEQSAERLEDKKKYGQTSTNVHELCKNKTQASRVDALSDRRGIVHFAARFSLRCFLLSALSFLVNGFFLELRILTLIVS